MMKKHALLIGINNYRDESIRNLEYAEEDMYRLSSALETYCGFEPPKLIRSNKADSYSVFNAIQELKTKATPEDLFMFFFSGHGLEHENHGHLLLLPGVMRFALQRMQNETFAVRELQNLISELPCRQSVFVLDACRGGLDIKRKLGSTPMGEIAKRDIAAIKKQQRKSGKETLVICSCSPNEEALELPKLSGGVFTASLVKILKNRYNNRTGISLGNNLFKEIDQAMQKQLPPDINQHLYISGNLNDIILHPGKQKENVSPKESITPHFVSSEVKLYKCPICGRRNEEKDTFECVKCGKDYLCLAHFDKKLRCCEDCAEKIIDEQKAKENKFKAEQEHRRIEEERQFKAETERFRREEAERLKIEEEKQRKAETERFRREEAELKNIAAECRKENTEIKNKSMDYLKGVEVECPYCEDPFYCEDLGQSVECPSCQESFTINEQGEATGVEVECPYCEDPFYCEDLGQSVECPSCQESFTINEQGEATGIEVECPYCEDPFYSEDFGQSVECPYCQESFTINEQGEATGIEVECPYCEEPFYTEDLGQSVECPSCQESFTINEQGEATGIEVECPYCEEPFYTEDLGQSVDCPECQESFTTVKKN